MMATEMIVIFHHDERGVVRTWSEVGTLVRCKACKWYKTNYSWNGKEHKVCVIEPYEPVRKDDDFCSRGEQKDD